MSCLNDWIGKTETAHDTVSPASLDALAACLDYEVGVVEPGDVVPPLWHQIYCCNATTQSMLGVDGHPRKGEFWPPVNLARRMTVGNSIRFLKPLHVGDSLSRTSRISSLVEKEGSSGPLTFISVEHEYSGPDGLSILEVHDVVYRGLEVEGGRSNRRPPAPVETVSSAQKTLTPNEVMLFRYSALTFNAHRIHYDRRYAMDNEGYPGLLVQGPLTATLLADFVRELCPDEAFKKLEYRAVSPLFVNEPIAMYAKIAEDNSCVDVWAANPAGDLALKATVTFD